MTVPQLVSFIKWSIQMKNDDRQVADYVKNIKLTNKLDARTVEELQGQGAGPRTMAALRELITATSALPAAVTEPAPIVVTIPPPDSIEQKKILEEIRQKALDYTKSLPNFITTQVTRRRVDPAGNQGWRLQDTFQEQLSYVDGKEDYKVTLVNNLPVTGMSHTQLGGVTSSGEFGTMLYQIFARKTQTTFEWERWATLRSRRMYVFNFRVKQENSEYSVYHGGSGRSIIAGYHGLIFADRDTKQVMRIQMDCDNLENFPINQISEPMDYDFTKISDQEFVLPLKVDVRSREGRVGLWNEIEFRLYRRFSADAQILFDVPDPVPEDQLKEQPAQPDPAKRK